MKKLLIVVIFGFLFGCTTEETDDALLDFGYGYAPLQLGDSIGYQIDSIDYNEFTATVDTFSFQRLEVTESVTTNLEGDSSYIIAVYIRQHDTLNWTKKYVYFKTPSKTNLLKLESNLITIPLIFPVQQDSKWNGNARNTLGYQEYSFTNINAVEVINGITFNAVCTIVQQDETNLIEQKYSVEKYALGLGLISKKHIDLETTLSGDIKSGFDVSYTYLEKY